MSNTTLDVANLDINSIKESLINHLKNQNTFKDYDFSASNLSILLDTLAYNTFYNGYYLNMLANESFLDSAILRDSIVSIAKHLGYVPSSVNTSFSIVDITLNTKNSTKPYIIIPKNTIFTSSVGNNRYTFYPDKDYMCYLTLNNTYTADNVKLLEGTRLSQQYIVNSNNLNQKFLIDNTNVDISTLDVSILDSINSTNKTIYTRANNILELNNNSLVYFVEEITDKKYQIYFGDNIIGKGLNIGNVINIDYIVSSGNGVNGASKFSCSTLIDNNVISTKISTLQNAGGYKDIESTDSIKLLAPLTYETQYRAVTQLDYESILKQNLPNAQYIKVWGGEDNDPPYYGKVFACVKPLTGLYLSTESKNELIRDYIQPHALMSTEIELVDAEYTYIVIDSDIYYKTNKTSLSSTELQNIIFNTIKDYANKELNGFDSEFKYSKFITYIDSIDSSIDNNLTKIRLKNRIYPVLQTNYNIKFSVNNELDHSSESAIKSTNFIYNNMNCYIRDDENGNLNIYTYINNIESIIKNNIGTITYNTGSINIENILIDSINDVQYIDFYLIPKISNIVTSKNQLLIITDEDITVNMFVEE